jgi:hypothetical protein
VRAGFAEGAPSNAVPACAQVGFVLVLRKLQGLTYPGCEAEESHAAAFDRHCGQLWQSAGDYGTEMCVVPHDAAAGFHLLHITCCLTQSHDLD